MRIAARFRLLAGVVAVCLAGPTLARADYERIVSFDSYITVREDGSMHVREDIRVHALGDQIRHGIYRDFPTQYKDKLGIIRRIPFKLMAVLRDGRPEEYDTSSLSNGVRIYLGNKRYRMLPGDYTYTITYDTDRQIGFYDDHDELYWNVTGNGWSLPIEHATATVSLPANIPRRVIETYGYTGPEGYTGRDFAARKDASGDLVYETKARLAPHDGFTLVAWWDKGYMQPPTDDQKFQYFLQDNRALIAALIGLVVLLLYQLVTWLWVGRDPKPGPIMPLYEPPPDLTPAAMRELVNMGFDDRAFTAALLGMAAKRYLTIDRDEAGAFAVTKSREAAAELRLTSEEKLLARRLFAQSNSVLLSPVNRVLLSEAMKTLKQSLAARMEKVYFVRHGNYLLPSVSLTLLTILVIVWTSDSQQRASALFFSVWLSIWSLGVVTLSLNAVNVWRMALRSQGKAAAKFAGAIFGTLFALPFIAGEIFGLSMLARATSVINVMVLALMIASNFLYHELLKAPTRLGRELMDKVVGFRLFLTATEGDRINRLAPVNMNMETFSKYLPYAVALDVEQHWAARFASVLEAATVSAGNGSSAALAGIPTITSLGASSGMALAGSLGDALNSAVSSASAAPGSRSGAGGGGSSGGGGGGGGGGGW